jgi:hypothetical protein
MNSSWDRLTLVLFATIVLLIAFTFRDYGMSWDEPFHIEYGARLLKFYASWGADTTAFSYINLYLYGGLFDVPVALLVQWLPFDLIDSRHLLIAITGLLGVAGTWRLARFIAGPRAGFFAALLLITMPGWYGHMFINPKDIPFATTMIWASYYLARLARNLHRPQWRDVVLFGLCAGMAMGLRIGGVLIFAYLGATLMLWFMATLLWSPARQQLLHDTLALLPRLITATVIAYGVMVLAWPWALSAPLQRPYEALTTFSHFPVIIPALVHGQWINSDQLPIDYLPLMIAIKVPLLQLLLLAGLAPLISRAVVRTQRLEHHNDTRWLPWGVTLIALLLPLAYALITRPGLYNEMRHFLFLLPPMAVLAGVGADLLCDHLQRRSVMLRTTAIGVALFYLAFHIASMARLHPYEYVHYNQIVGSVKGAERLFELDYWSTSQRELYAALKQHLRNSEGEQAINKPWRIRLCGAPEAALYYFEERWQPIWLGAKGEADFEVGIAGNGCPPPKLPATIEVRREGVLLGYVNDLRGR